MARHEGRARREKSPAVPPLALGWPNRPEKAADAAVRSTAAFLGFHEHNFGRL